MTNRPLKIFTQTMIMWFLSSILFFMATMTEPYFGAIGKFLILTVDPPLEVILAFGTLFGLVISFFFIAFLWGWAND